MEKFILLFRGSDVYQPDQSPEAYQKLASEMFSWLNALSAKGMHVSSEQFARTGRQIKGADRSLITEPFGALPEIIGGYTIIQAKDIDQAFDAAMACPILESNATIEIRPIQSIQSKM